MSAGDLNPSVATAVASFTRPVDTTAYASGDLVANSTTAGSVVPLTLDTSAVGGKGRITRVRLRKTGTSITNASFRLHLFEALPTVANGDNGVFSPTQSTYIGSIDLPVANAVAFSDGAAVFGHSLDGADIRFNTEGSTQLYGLLEARGAYTPASAEVFTVFLEKVPHGT